MKLRPFDKVERQVSYYDHRDQSFCDYCLIKLHFENLSVKLVSIASRLGLVIELLELVVYLDLILT